MQIMGKIHNFYNNFSSINVEYILCFNYFTEKEIT